MKLVTIMCFISVTIKLHIDLDFDEYQFMLLLLVQLIMKKKISNKYSWG